MRMSLGEKALVSEYVSIMLFFCGLERVCKGFWKIHIWLWHNTKLW